MKRFFTVLLVLLPMLLLAQGNTFPTSLHATRQGKATWYSAANGGFEALTNIPMSELPCQKCHAATYANGDPVDAATYAPGCNDCHDFAGKGTSVEQATCLGCHSRQGAEISLNANPNLTAMFSDVHRDAGMQCTSCHSKQEMHGDGTAYDSFLQPGATTTRCDNEGCHPVETLAQNPAHARHMDDLDCAACHVKTVVSCYNCHFETEVEAHKKRFYGKPPIFGFVMLVNGEKSGKVTTASFQSLVYKDTTFYAVGPFNGHTVTKEARDCDECHNAATVQQYNETGSIVVAKWDHDQGKLVNTKGVIPVPEDWKTALKLDFLKFKGQPQDPIDTPVDPSKWEYLKTGADASQMLYATPLTPEQMAKLSLKVPGIKNFQNSLHATRAGKDYWYNADTPAPVPGFETLTGVPIDHENVACKSCHSGNNLDANGNEYPKPWPGANCNDCHATEQEGAPVAESACLACHGRQATTWNRLGYTDVHRTESNKLECWDCHVADELHGADGVRYNSMLEPGAIKAACENCHTTEAGTLPNHSGYDPHGGKLSCDACHTKSVVSCYNCHFESQVENHLKRAKQQIHDFIILVNREKDGKVGTASFQSLSYQGNTWMAMGPFHGHTTMKEGRKCADCHANFGGNIPAINDYNEDGIMKFATWNDADSTLSWLRGVVPLPADYETTFKMDFITYNGQTSDPVGPSKNWSSIGEDTWDGHQLFFAKPLTKVQMAKLGFDTTATVGVRRDVAAIPDGYSLSQNYPNPFNPSTEITYELAKDGQVTLTIYNALGQKVKTLVNKKQPAGKYIATWDGMSDAGLRMSSGIYYYRLETDQFNKTMKMVMIK